MAASQQHVPFARASPVAVQTLDQEKLPQAPPAVVLSFAELKHHRQQQWVVTLPGCLLAVGLRGACAYQRAQQLRRRLLQKQHCGS